MRIVGAGLGRTGTLSLKLALEKLTGGRCYHMVEVFANPDHLSLWRGAGDGRMPDWRALFAGYDSVVDWPAASFWPELMQAFPDSILLLSLRHPDSWWRSAHDTIFPSIRRAPAPFREMVESIFRSRFTDALEDRDACIAAYEAHNAAVRRGVPPERLVTWRASEGWGPLCKALGLPIPAEPFPHANSTEDFLARIASMAPPPRSD
jgi:sulfotransferase family protein